jgi:hypothetical protein
LRPHGDERILLLMEFWTIEVADGPSWSATGWRRSHGERLVEAALTHGAKEWNWVIRDWGVLVEISFTDENEWLRFRGTPAVRAALDAAPDPIHGLWIYSGRGGSSPATVPVHPRPHRGSDSAPPPEPEPAPELWQVPLGLRQSSVLDPPMATAS